jgi:hypothetical protein
MGHPTDIAASSAEPLSPVVSTPEPVSEPAESDRSGMAFSRALAQVEAHRARVRIALGIALVARLLLEFRLVSLVGDTDALVAQTPYIGLALLSYLIVLWFLAVRTRDRFGFGMALGIGVLQATYLVVMVATQRPFSIAMAWSPLVVAAAHVPMAITAFRASTAYPPFGGKQPWIVGFATALVFVAIPWVAPAAVEAMRSR